MTKTLTNADRAIMTRLFGPELPTDDPFIAETEYAKSVEWSGDHSRAAVDTLLLSIVHDGCGGGMVIGWSLELVGDRTRLAVRRIKAKLA